MNHGSCTESGLLAQFGLSQRCKTQADVAVSSPQPRKVRGPKTTESPRNVCEKNWTQVFLEQNRMNL